MGSFTKPLKIMPVGKGRWQLLEPFEFYTKNAEWLVEVPQGFIMDFASIPRVLWSLYPPYHETYGKAAVIHDWLYATQELNHTPITRKWADQQFLEGMAVLGANWTRRTLMYQMVRWFAGGAWKGHQTRMARERELRDMIREELERRAHG